MRLVDTKLHYNNQVSGMEIKNLLTLGTGFPAALKTLLSSRGLGFSEEIALQSMRDHLESSDSRPDSFRKYFKQYF